MVHKELGLFLDILQHRQTSLACLCITSFSQMWSPAPAPSTSHTSTLHIPILIGSLHIQTMEGCRDGRTHGRQIASWHARRLYCSGQETRSASDRAIARILCLAGYFTPLSARSETLVVTWTVSIFVHTSHFHVESKCTVNYDNMTCVMCIRITRYFIMQWGEDTDRKIFSLMIRNVPLHNPVYFLWTSVAKYIT